ncbi:MAG: hypothetical protein KAR19_19640 [Bacteroidales bacterium]|nr:hypothetical protein [Bacteroidales bacterium]
MKTTKLFLSIALVALTATSFGQLSLIDRLFSKRHNEVVYYTADYKAESCKTETWMVDLRDWANNKVSRDAYEAPVVSITYIVDMVEVVYEDELGLESWMSAPFECDICESEFLLESWMTTPFESSVVENELCLESWMTAPFEAAEDIEIEEWMTAAFI